MTAVVGTQNTDCLSRHPAVYVLIDEQENCTISTPLRTFQLPLAEIRSVEGLGEILINGTPRSLSQALFENPILGELLDQGILIRGTATAGDPMLGQLSFPSVTDPGALAIRIGGAPESASIARIHLERLGVTPVSSGETTTRAVRLIFANALTNGLLDENRQALQAQEICLYVFMFPEFIRVGPLVIPGETACLQCFYWRARASASDEPTWLALQEISASRSHSIMVEAIAGLVGTLEAVRIASGSHNGIAPATFRDLSLVNWSSTAHQVLRLPSCPSCGGAGGRSFT